MSEVPALRIDDPHPGVRLLTLNRPERRNALATPLLADIAQALATAAADDGVRVVVVTGGPTIFAAGADIAEIDRLDASDPVESPRFLAWRGIRDFPKPMIAAVEGWCLGAGLELAMASDIVIAGEGARFGQPETNLGIIPGGGGTVMLPRLVGRALATRMILTGEPIDAVRALAAGLIAETVADGAAGDAAMAMANRLAARAPLALAAAKAALRGADNGFVEERRRFVALLGTADKAEGIAAFREKRAPDWRGR